MSRKVPQLQLGLDGNRLDQSCHEYLPLFCDNTCKNICKNLPQNHISLQIYDKQNEINFVKLYVIEKSPNRYYKLPLHYQFKRFIQQKIKQEISPHQNFQKKSTDRITTLRQIQSYNAIHKLNIFMKYLLYQNVVGVWSEVGRGGALFALLSILFCVSFFFFFFFSFRFFQLARLVEYPQIFSSPCLILEKAVLMLLLSFTLEINSVCNVQKGALIIIGFRWQQIRLILSRILAIVL
eukprot:TRINITY_DN36577_c0_g1_i1.p1 TRINITY_DN36577_c0_g1~~TRINITY_DN36577_c0_g1_i1.p1  ORF type:complete len:237 (+),score=-8.28 TRINITY_DN36577_c0_g1_i1:450-1160(+)